MKQFGLSENFILMDDDYFIAKPINKNEMFYEDNGEIYPAIITSDYYEMNQEIIDKSINEFKKKKDGTNPHSPNGFYAIQKQSLLFLYDLFGNDTIRYGKKLIEPAFSHNAIPMKISDIEEIERSMNDLQFQTLYWAYVKNKYNRKVSKISSEFYDLMQSNKILANKKKLFVINTSSRYYSYAIFMREKANLAKLFPIKSKYEIDEGENQTETNQKIINSIINSVINEINNKVDLNINKFLKEINITKPKKKNEEYEKILKEEIELLKNQIFGQEITNLFFVFFFIFMIVRIYLTKKN